MRDIPDPLISLHWQAYRAINNIVQATHPNRYAIHMRNYGNARAMGLIDDSDDMRLSTVTIDEGDLVVIVECYTTAIYEDTIQRESAN